MSGSVTVVVVTLAAALLFAVSSTSKHASAVATPAPDLAHGHGIARFLRATVTHRLWLIGIACDVVALALQVIALHLGTLAVVQPLLIAGLVFALLLRRATGRRHVTGPQLAWAGVLAAALAAFIALATTGSAPASGGVDRMPAVLAGVAGVVVVIGCVVLGRRTSSRGGAAALLGTAVGLLYAATAALLKTLSDIAVADPVRLLASWQLYVTVVLGVAGLALNQLAFQAGPLAASLPATSAVDPLASIVIGVVVFDEQIRRLSGAGVLLVLLLLVLAVSVVALARAAPGDEADGHANQAVQKIPASRQ